MNAFIVLPILRAIEASCQELNIEPQRVVIVTSSLPGGFESAAANLVLVAPGQEVSISIGLATANPALRIFAIATADVQYRRSISSLLDAAHRNHNVKLLIGNALYQRPSLDPLGLAITGDCSFVSRGFIGDPQQLKSLVSMATRNDGCAIIDVVTPEVGSDKSFAWYRRNAQKIAQTSNKQLALQALQTADKNVNGVIFQKRRASFQTDLLKRIPSPLVDQPLRNINIRPLLKDLK